MCDSPGRGLSRMRRRPDLRYERRALGRANNATREEPDPACRTGRGASRSSRPPPSVMPPGKANTPFRKSGWAHPAAWKSHRATMAKSPSKDGRKTAFSCALVQKRVTALLVTADPFFDTRRDRIVDEPMLDSHRHGAHVFVPTRCMPRPTRCFGSASQRPKQS